jgi:hypothetical protein
MRALAILDRAIHPDSAAILLETAKKQELLAAREATSAEDPRLIERILLTDQEMPVGALLIGRRSDGNRYNRQELEAIHEIVPSLAEALRVSRGRFSSEIQLQQRIDDMAARLARIEGEAPRLA